MKTYYFRGRMESFVTFCNELIDEGRNEIVDTKIHTIVFVDGKMSNNFEAIVFVKPIKA